MTELENFILEGSIKKLLFKFSIPAISVFLANVLYNIIDAIFIGNQPNGSLGIAALTIVFPIQQIILALSQMIGVGIASITSRSLGAGDKLRAEKAVGTALTSSVLLGILIMVIGLVFIRPMLYIFGSLENILPYAVTFFRITLYCSVFFVFSIVANSIIQSEGHANIAMISMIIGPVINIPLDYILVTRLQYGIKGAAIATDISQIICFIFLLVYICFNSKILGVKVKNLTINIKLLKEAISLGLSTFMTQLAYGILAIVLNNSLKIYGGSDLYVSAIGIYNRVFGFITITMYGIRQALQPIIGFNYGAKKFDRVKQSLKLAILGSVAISLVFLVIIISFTNKIAGVFTSDNELIVLTVPILRLLILMSPLVGVQVIASSFFQYIGKPKPALFLSIMKPVLFVIPLMLIIPIFLKVTGIFVSVPLADFLAAMISLIFIYREIKKMNKLNLIKGENKNSHSKLC
ncbi:MATE family efflux transporter [Clostridium beijerinckii]|uniref:Multidrug export protein MepA n=1 Tax=Clostridium beijerinckii TaxID=1520 RepID=A0A1S9N4Q6_CLOBE|nr:MATE family efflux transporter [Clostridium beijerinckii]MZK51421.1 MATE family efflux transporter [Clostridium beijerinckii]MZK59621.1 MATE family efflux transporter [Clostridium beijerinckii]MZK69741.1 MATE family efflux transporter [Clostridium beijerinckii]MZK75118.1 MATE family efflux transporter [Clostridium beijerinckii]MZK84831.1 MATE family efflux transporter [Clostridium beijerinckii]